MKEQLETQNFDLVQPAIFDTSADSGNVVRFRSTLKELRSNVEPKMLRHREGLRGRDGRPRTVEYIEWHTVADILDETASNWNHTVKDIKPLGDYVVVTVAITIDGVTREGIGTGSARSEMGIKKAEHDALKRAAVKFGIARDLYKRDSENVSAALEKAEPTDTVARTISDLITTKQMGMIRAIAREQKIDADVICKEVMKCKINELSRKAASQLIDLLQEQPAATPMRKAG